MSSRQSLDTMIPEVWYDILEDIHRAVNNDDSIYLVGGSLADLYLGGSCKDIDVVIDVKNEESLSTINQQILSKLRVTYRSAKIVDDNSASLTGDDPGLSRGFLGNSTFEVELEPAVYITIDIVYYNNIENIEDLVNRFDLNHVMLGMSYSKVGIEYYIDPKFDEFMETKELKVVNKLLKTPRRVKKLLAKYPEIKYNDKDDIIFEFEDEIPF